MSILNNTNLLNSLLEQANNLPDAENENLNEEFSTQATLLSEQDAKIAELAEVLAGKAAGGSVSYDTCTLIINGVYNGGNRIIYTKVVNGALQFANADSYRSTITDVLCGSTVCFPGNYLNMKATAGICHFYGSTACCYTAPVESGATATITLTQD